MNYKLKYLKYKNKYLEFKDKYTHAIDQECEFLLSRSMDDFMKIYFNDIKYDMAKYIIVINQIDGTKECFIFDNRLFDSYMFKDGKKIKYTSVNFYILKNAQDEFEKKEKIAYEINKTKRIAKLQRDIENYESISEEDINYLVRLNLVKLSNFDKIEKKGYEPYFEKWYVYIKKK